MSGQNDIESMQKLSSGSFLEFEIQVARDLIAQVEKCESELIPAIELVSFHRKKFREGWKLQSPKMVVDPPPFFPIKKFMDNLKSNSASQTELKKRIFAVDSKFLSLSAALQRNRIKNCEQDERMDELEDIFLNIETVLKTMRSEMEKYTNRAETLSKKIEMALNKT